MFTQKIGWHSLAFSSSPPVYFPEELWAFVSQTSLDRFGGSQIALPQPRSHLSWESLCVSMAEKERLNNKACQMSVGHSGKGHFC